MERFILPASDLRVHVRMIKGRNTIDVAPREQYGAPFPLRPLNRHGTSHKNTIRGAAGIGKVKKKSLGVLFTAECHSDDGRTSGCSALFIMKLHRNTKHAPKPAIPRSRWRPLDRHGAHSKTGAGDILEDSRGVRGDTIRGAAGDWHRKKGPGFLLAKCLVVGMMANALPG